MIQELVPLVPTELVFNLDETGLSDWEERKRQPVLTPAEIDGDVIHYPIDRRIRHQTLVCCISGAGDVYCPLLISSDANARSVFEKGVRDGIDLRVEIAGSAYIMTDFFLQYLRDMPIPAVESNRRLPGCRNKPSILFCDNCRCHCSDEILKELANHGVLLITYPPHTSPSFQVPDVLLFGWLKAAKKHLTPSETLSSQLDDVMRVFRTDEIATTSTTIRSSWEKTGFEFHQRDRALYLSVNEQKIRNSDECVEVWRIDYPKANRAA
jgi:hypothetical protein